jgi:RHS repeat-associated protein
MLSMYGSLADANSYRFSSKEWNQNSGLYYYLYRLYDANAQRWLNRDCLGETGFEVLRGHNNTRELALRTRVGPIGRNLYGFVRNQPLNKYDPLGLAERGPGTIACQQATEQAEAAWALAESEPGNIELENSAILLSFNAAIMCSPPPPPPTSPTPCPPKTPWWKSVGNGILDILDRLGRIPIFIFDPCGPLGDPTLCPGGRPPIA